MYEQNDILIWVCLFVFAQISSNFDGDNSGSDFNTTISGPSLIAFAWMFQLAAGIAQFWSGFSTDHLGDFWPLSVELQVASSSLGHVAWGPSQ